MTAVKPITLKEWIEKEGVDTIAKALSTHPSAVRHWRRGMVLPNSAQMFKIRKLSRGAVSFDHALERHFSPSNKKRKR